MKEAWEGWGKGGGDAGLLSENHQKISLSTCEDLLINEAGVPLLWITSYTASLSG